VLLVANHPNSLLDPAFISWAAGRPVRFLAKAPLFRHPIVGWLVRGSGSLPVYRRKDDATQVSRNDETFRAVHEALGGGSAVALFPEGISHSEPGLVPLKTGAARIALGAVTSVGGAFPIVPIGLVFRAKDRFRSEAHAVVGEPIVWDDLASRTPDDVAAVRELTARIDRGIRTVTLNLARWEDEAVVRTAEATWAAARNADPSPAAHVARLAVATDALAHLRASGDQQWAALALDVEEHGRVLHAMGMTPASIHVNTDLAAAARWALRRLRVVGLAQVALAAVTAVLFWIPYRLTGIVAGLVARNRDAVSTHRVIGGALIFSAWIGGLAALAGAFRGWAAGIATLMLLPIIAVGGLHALEHWRFTLSTARRWLLLRGRDPRVTSLRERQQELASRLDHALAAHGLDR
jgi:1-acyl-sn-glycerol-3-phosphate acyltransferase